MTPLSSAPRQQGYTSRTHFHSLQTSAGPARAGRCPQLHSVWAPLQLDGSLTSYWQDLATPGRDGGGEEESKANFVSQRETIAADSCP